MIQGYDEWKSTPPEENTPVRYCTECGEAIHEGDVYYDKGFGENLCRECNEAGKHIA